MFGAIVWWFREADTAADGVREDDAVDVVVADLLPGERIVWQGSPVRHGLFRAADAVLVPF